MTEEKIRPHIRSKIFGKKIFYQEKIDSTNSKAKELLRDGGANGTVVIAGEQSAGRGRMNRRWLSEPKKNLTFSVIFRADIPPEKIGLISIYAGLSVSEALKEIYPEMNFVCKWPNDIQINGKKICGILSESAFESNSFLGAVIGVGLNVNQKSFPGELDGRATSLSLLAGGEQDLFGILGGLLGRMEYNYDFIRSGDYSSIIGRFTKNSAMFGREVEIENGGKTVRGTARRLDDDGSLIVSTGAGEQRIIAGELRSCY